MRDLTAGPGPGKKAYLELPDDMPEVIGDTAREITEDEDTDYDKVLALQRYFRAGSFRYSETAPVAEDYDGNGVDVIAKFLEAKSGYCVHFSSAMAVMARTLDIPSRIAVGYAPGSTSGFNDGKTRYENTSDDLHAWTEIYFDGVGWVRFDPTPSVGSPTAFVEPASESSTRPGTGGDHGTGRGGAQGRRPPRRRSAGRGRGDADRSPHRHRGAGRPGAGGRGAMARAGRPPPLADEPRPHRRRAVVA